MHRRIYVKYFLMVSTPGILKTGESEGFIHFDLPDGMRLKEIAISWSTYLIILMSK
jgi:hypothetical protein